jgi:hypothetical protein
LYFSYILFSSALAATIYQKMKRFLAHLACLALSPTLLIPANAQRAHLVRFTLLARAQALQQDLWPSRSGTILQTTALILCHKVRKKLHSSLAIVR